MRTTLAWVAAGLALTWCSAGCTRRRQQGEVAVRTLDYAPFMKASSDGIAAELARHLGIALSPAGAPDGGARDDRRVLYPVAPDGVIVVRLDRRGQPLAAHYRGPVGCPGVARGAAPAITPAAANASVLSLLRAMAIPVDDTAVVDSRLHAEGRMWLGVHVRQSYRGEPIEMPSAFAIVDGSDGRVCELRVPRWYAGLGTVGPPMSEEALRLHAQMVAARIAGGPVARRPALGGLRILSDTLCREVTFSGAPERTLWLDVVSGDPATEP